MCFSTSRKSKQLRNSNQCLALIQYNIYIPCCSHIILHCGPENRLPNSGNSTIREACESRPVFPKDLICKKLITCHKCRFKHASNSCVSEAVNDSSSLSNTLPIHTDLMSQPVPTHMCLYGTQSKKKPN